MAAGIEAYGVAARLYFADVVTDSAFGVGVVVRAQLGELGLGVGSRARMTTRIERPTATMARFSPRATAPHS